MHLIFIIISSISLLYAQTDWKNAAEQIVAEKNVQQSIEYLKRIPDLDKSLIKALESGSTDERLAFAVIRKLRRTSMVAYLIKRLNELKMDDQIGVNYFINLASLASTSRGKDIVEALTKKVSFLNAKDSAPLKITLISAHQLADVSIKPVVIEKLLDDESYELRAKAMDAVEIGFQKDQTSYKSVFKKALTISPYTVRLKAVDYITRLTAGDKIQFQIDLNRCASTDTNDLVKDACRGLLTK